MVQNSKGFICTPMLTAVLFTRQVVGNSSVHNGWMNKQDMICAYNEILFNIKDRNQITCYNMDEP